MILFVYVYSKFSVRFVIMVNSYVVSPLFLQADASLEMEQRHFCQASLEYVFLLQEVQERKKFEFVETVRPRGY